MTGIFKAYDIRGVYPSEVNEDIAYKIGRAFVTFLKTKQVLVGKDARLSSPKVFKALAKGITDQGADVIEIGLCSTPMFYYATSKAKSGIMVTASHNPKQFNGFKLTREKAIPISEVTGIKQIESLVKKNKFKEVKTKGKIIKKNILNDYIKHSTSFLKTKTKFKIVVDAGNGMGAYTFPKIFKKTKLKLIPLYCTINFNFPNHEPNPLKYETLKVLQKTVLKQKADLGVALDGDGDRCVLIDEKGEIVGADLITALIAKYLLKTKPKSTILYDLRSSNIVPEYIKQLKGKPIMSRVGHSFIKKQMRKENAIFAGELSGHFYHKENSYAENSFITLARVLNLLTQEKKKLSELAKPLRKYYQTGEINFKVKDKVKKQKQIENKYKSKAKKILHLDGTSIYLKDWWFNLRPSNTESLLRLNLEADNKELMQKKKKEVIRLIKS